MEFINPKYSFVKFGEPESIISCCEGQSIFCIPVVEENDTFFQFSLKGDTPLEGYQIFNAPASTVQLKLLKGIGNTPETVGVNVLRNWTVDDSLVFERFRATDLETVFIWKNVFKNIVSFVKCNECFELAVTVSIGDTTITRVSSCFVRSCDSCYTSVLEYSGDQDDFGFRYCNGEAVNRVRLPFYFRHPILSTDRAIYNRSNGTIKTTRSTTSKEYSALTNNLPEYVHEKLVVALNHDTTMIVGDRYSGGFQVSGEYAINWVENLCTATASFKALVSPYLVKNNNCKECVPVNGILCNAIISQPTSEFIEDTGWVISWELLSGEPIKYFIQTPGISGGAPMETTETSYTYGWLPPGDNLIKVWGICEIEGSLFPGASKELLITVCVPVEISGSAPDGQVGVPFYAEWDLSGTPPFERIGTLIRPLGCFFSIDGNKAIISGTPVNDIEEQSIVFTISNCNGENEVTINEVITIAP